MAGTPFAHTPVKQIIEENHDKEQTGLKPHPKLHSDTHHIYDRGYRRRPGTTPALEANALWRHYWFLVHGRGLFRHLHTFRNLYLRPG